MRQSTLQAKICKQVLPHWVSGIRCGPCRQAGQDLSCLRSPWGTGMRNPRGERANSPLNEPSTNH